MSRFAGELARIISSTLSARLSRKVALKPLRPQTVGVEELPLPAVLWRMSFTRGLSGWAMVLFRAADALTLAQLLSGQEAGSAPLPVEGQDGLREAAAQVAGALAFSLGNLGGRSIGCEPPQVVWAKGEGELRPLFEGEKAEAMLAGFEVEGVLKSEVLVILQPSLLLEIQEVFAPSAGPSRSSGDNPFPSLSEDLNSCRPQGIDLLLDVPLVVTVELGRARMPIREVLQLSPGSVIELDKLAGEPVDILVNEKPIARGEVVVIGESFGVRLTHIVNQAERVQSLRERN